MAFSPHAHSPAWLLSEAAHDLSASVAEVVRLDRRAAVEADTVRLMQPTSVSGALTGATMALSTRTGLALRHRTLQRGIGEGGRKGNGQRQREREEKGQRSGGGGGGGEGVDGGHHSARGERRGEVGRSSEMRAGGCAAMAGRGSGRLRVVPKGRPLLLEWNDGRMGGGDGRERRREGRRMEAAVAK